MLNSSHNYVYRNIYFFSIKMTNCSIRNLHSLIIVNAQLTQHYLSLSTNLERLYLALGSISD